MNGVSKTVCVFLLSCGYAASAAAATTSPAPDSQTDNNASPAAQNPAHVSQRLHDDLAKAGFTDITIMPSSFLVRAKDSQGNPVMMIINPDSMTEVTEHKEAPLAGAIKGAPNSPIPSPPAKQP